MKILISADIEGIQGIPHYDYFKNSKKLKESQKKLVEQINYHIDILNSLGIKDITVVDGHGSKPNFASKEINAKVEPKKSKYPMLGNLKKKYDAAIFLGYHGKANKPKSFYAHTNSTKLISNVKINEKEVSEAEMNSYVLKSLGIKPIYLYGTDKACEEIKAYDKNIKIVPTNKSINYFKSTIKNKKQVHKEIKQKLEKAIEDYKPINPKNNNNNIWKIQVPQIYLLSNLDKKYKINYNNRQIIIKGTHIVVFLKYRKLIKELKINQNLYEN